MRSSEGRYSSTARCFLPTRFARRCFQPVTGRVEIQQTRRGGYDDRSENDAQQSKDTDSAQHADEHDQPAHLRAPTDYPRPNEIVHQSHNHAAEDRDKNPAAQVPSAIRLMAAGTQIRAEPTSGTSEKNPIMTPQKTGALIPARPKASPPRMPCAAAATRLDATLAKIRSLRFANHAIAMRLLRRAAVRVPWP